MSMSSQSSPMNPLSSTQQNQIAGQSLTLNKIPNPLEGQFNTQNLYNQYSGLMFGGGQPSSGLQPGIAKHVTLDSYSNGPGLGQPPATTGPTGGQNGNLPTHTEQVPAQVTDYTQLFNSLNQYLNSMNQLLGQWQQK